MNTIWLKIKSDQRLLLIFLFFVGLSVRLIFIVLYPGKNYYAGSSERYLRIAENIINGNGLSVYVDTSKISSPIRQFVYQPFIDKPAGYPFLLTAIISIFGYSLISIQLFHAFALALIGPLFFLICHRQTKNFKYGFICGFGGAIWLNTARFDVVILPEALVPLPIAITLYLLSIQHQSSKEIWKNGLLAGLSISIGIFLRPDVALLPIFLLAGTILVYGMKYSFKIFVPIILSLAFGLSFQMIYNYNNSGGKFIPLGYSNGIAAFEGISQFGDTLSTVYSDDRLKILEDQSDLYYPRGPERDVERTKKAFAIIKDRPLWYFVTLIKRIPILLTPRGLFIIGNDTPTQKKQDDFTQKFPASFINEWKEAPLNAFVKLFSSLIGITLIFLSAVGCWKWRKKYKIWILPFCVVAYFFFSHIPLNVEPRYFFPAVPFLIFLAGTFFIKKW
jgi:4-amino-4-deoxy-L-arabinose transferase-like glycosyltransferase